MAPAAKIALISNDAIGNYALSSIVAQSLLSKSEGATLTYFCGSRAAEFMDGSTWITTYHDIFSDPLAQVVEKARGSGPFDLVMNIENSPWSRALASIIASDAAVCGPSLTADGRGDLPFEDDWHGDLWRDKEWISADLTHTYPELESGFIGEIFTRLCYASIKTPTYAIPSKSIERSVPDVLIATSASLKEKLWPMANWKELAHRLDQMGMTVGLLGAKPSDQAKFWKGASEEDQLLEGSKIEDLRGELRLPEVVGAIQKAKLVITLDNGIVHLAASTQTPTIGLFRFGIHRLWAPPVAHLAVMHPGPHRTVQQISVAEVLENLNNFQLNFSYL